MKYQKVIHVDNLHGWLDERRNSVGASDTLSGRELYQKANVDMSGRVSAFEYERPDAAATFESGHAMEQAILAWWGASTGMPVTPSGWLLRNPEFPWMHASLDGWNEGEYAVEAKNPGFTTAYQWLDLKNYKVAEGSTMQSVLVAARKQIMAATRREDPPRRYWEQCQHQLAVTGYQRAYLVGVIAGQKLVWYEIKRDEKAIKERIVNCKAFMEKAAKLREEQRYDSRGI